VPTRSRPLIAADELLASIHDPRLRIADVRWVLGAPAEGRRRYDEGHIPGATFVDLESDLSAHEGPGRHPLPDPSAFAARLGALGFGDEHAMVVYDDAGGTVAARLWWMLDALGHPDVRLLDGGMRAWVAAGGTLERRSEPRAGATLSLADAWPRTLDREAVRDRRPDQVVVDMRAAERYRGEVEPVDPVAGHIPGAVNLPASSLLDGDDRLLSADDIRSRWASAAGAPLGEVELVVSCGSGVTACLGVLATRVAGLPEDAILYPGSYSDWSRSGMPVATGHSPGDLDRPT
jgi:thiosulfate/3-mercaptopyruvate sulfurtransferase